MTNKYLEKMAKDRESNSIEPVTLGAGLYAAKASVPKLLGYHKVYHGTSEDKAQSILRGGFDPKKGGTGAAKGHRGFERQSAGKIHVTKSYPNARMFAAFTSEGKPLESIDQQAKAALDALKLRGSVLHARVPQSYWDAMKPDPDMGNVKPTAATFHHKIDPKYVGGAGSVKSIAPHLSAKHLLKYYRANPGRALTGLGLAAGGSALIASQIPKIKAKFKSNPESTA